MFSKQGAYSIPKPVKSLIRVHTPAGHGTNDNTVLTFTIIQDKEGIDIEYIRDAGNLGDSFVIKTPGLYFMVHSNSRSAGGAYCGISRNRTVAEINTSVNSLSAASRLASVFIPTGGYENAVSLFWLDAGDIIRACDDSSCNDTSNLSYFLIVKVS